MIRLSIVFALLLLVTTFASRTVGSSFDFLAAGRYPVPTSHPGVSAFGYHAPVISGNGALAFHGGVPAKDGSFNVDAAIWTRPSGGKLNLVAYQSYTPPGVGLGGYIYRFGTTIDPVPVVNDSGHSAFYGILVGYGPSDVVYENNAGIWSQAPDGSLQEVVRKGQVPSGLNAHARIDFVVPPSIHFNNVGQTAFVAGRTSGDEALYIGTNSSNLRLVAAESVVFSVYSGVSPKRIVQNIRQFDLNDLGQVAIVSNVGLWLETLSGDLEGVAYSNYQAPSGTIGATRFRDVTDADLNNQGSVAFQATYYPDGSSNVLSGIWNYTPGSDLMVTVKSTDIAAGVSGGAEFSGFTSFNYGDDGTLAFHANVAGATVDATNDTGLWTARGDRIELVAREGGFAPGTSDGLVFGNLGTPLVNARGQVAFSATLNDAITGQSVGNGIWAQKVDGELTLIARTGDTVPGNEAVFSDVASLSTLTLYTGGKSGMLVDKHPSATGFDDWGHIAFSSTVFSNGALHTALFVSDAVAIPEPSAVWLLCVPVGLAAICRRRVNIDTR